MKTRFQRSLRRLIRQPHNREYQFFREYEGMTGDAVIVGYNGGDPLRSLRLYNRSLGVVLIESHPFFEKELTRLSQSLKGRFVGYITRLSNDQEHHTVFLPMKRGRADHTAATFDRQEVAHLLEKADAITEVKTREALEKGRDLKQATEAGARIITQLTYVEQPLDNLRVPADVIIVEDTEADPGMFEGMVRTMERRQATLMIPNQGTLFLAASAQFSERGWRPYAYNPKTDILAPFDLAAGNSRTALFIHQTVFNGSEPTRLRP